MEIKVIIRFHINQEVFFIDGDEIKKGTIGFIRGPVLHKDPYQYEVFYASYYIHEKSEQFEYNDLYEDRRDALAKLRTRMEQATAAYEREVALEWESRPEKPDLELDNSAGFVTKTLLVQADDIESIVLDSEGKVNL